MQARYWIFSRVRKEIGDLLICQVLRIQSALSMTCAHVVDTAADDVGLSQRHSLCVVLLPLRPQPRILLQQRALRWFLDIARDKRALLGRSLPTSFMRHEIHQGPAPMRQDAPILSTASQNHV